MSWPFPGGSPDCCLFTLPVVGKVSLSIQARQLREEKKEERKTAKEKDKDRGQSFTEERERERRDRELGV